jgi:hypothetical protein
VTLALVCMLGTKLQVGQVRSLKPPLISHPSLASTSCTALDPTSQHESAMVTLYLCIARGSYSCLPVDKAQVDMYATP